MWYLEIKHADMDADFLGVGCCMFSPWFHPGVWCFLGPDRVSPRVLFQLQILTRTVSKAAFHY